jgi:hypothetical protein
MKNNIVKNKRGVMEILSEVKITTKDGKTYDVPITILKEDLSKIILEKANRSYDFEKMEITKMEIKTEA